jgi:hypothetical protein
VNVVIKINGREAIPVRALPFLSDRKTMSPDVVANVFAGDEYEGTSHFAVTASSAKIGLFIQSKLF